MLIKDFKASIPFLMNARVTPLVWGAAGVGKSDSIRQVCAEHGWHFTDLRLGSMADCGDLIGLADFKVNNKGEKVATRFFMPDWLREAIDFCEANPDKKSILFLDEINRCRKDLMAPIFQMVLDHRLHTYEFPKNLFLTAAANFNTDDYSVSDFSDKALVSRFAHIKLSPSVKEWADHANEQGYDSSVTSFIQSQPAMLEKKGEEFSLEDFVEPSRRSWAMVSRLLKSGMPTNLVQEYMYGVVGITATAAYYDSLKNADVPLTGEEVIKTFKKVKDKIAKWSDSNEHHRRDLVKSTSDNVVAFVRKVGVDKGKLTKTQGENMIDFLTMIPVEVAFSACQDLYLEDIARDFFKEDSDLIKNLEKAKAAGIVKTEQEPKIEETK